MPEDIDRRERIFLILGTFVNRRHGSKPAMSEPALMELAIDGNSNRDSKVFANNVQVAEGAHMHIFVQPKCSRRLHFCFRNLQPEAAKCAPSP